MNTHPDQISTLIASSPVYRHRKQSPIAQFIEYHRLGEFMETIRITTEVTFLNENEEDRKVCNVRLTPFPTSILIWVVEEKPSSTTNHFAFNAKEHSIHFRETGTLILLNHAIPSLDLVVVIHPPKNPLLKRDS